MRAIQLLELSIRGRVSMKLSPFGATALGASRYARRKPCITGLIKDCGSFRHGVPVCACWPDAFVGSGFPDASQRNGLRKNLVPLLKVEYGLKICRLLPEVRVKSPFNSAAVGI